MDGWMTDLIFFVVISQNALLMCKKLWNWTLYLPRVPASQTLCFLVKQAKAKVLATTVVTVCSSRTSRSLDLHSPDKTFPLAAKLPSPPSFLFLHALQQAVLWKENTWELQTRLPPLRPFTSEHVLACISTLGWDSCCAAETCDTGGSGATSPDHTVHILRRALWPFILHLAPHNYRFTLSSNCSSHMNWGGRWYVFDLPLREIKFGDIRTKRRFVLPPPHSQPGDNVKRQIILASKYSLFPYRSSLLISHSMTEHCCLQTDDIELQLSFKFPPSLREINDENEKGNSQNLNWQHEVPSLSLKVTWTTSYIT